MATVDHERSVDNIVVHKRNKKPRVKDHNFKKPSVEVKKSRPQLVHNRFTNIVDLQNRSEPCNEFFGSLVLDFSKDPAAVNILDANGNYLLEVPHESLREFKMQILMGEDKRSRPNFTILLGDCQCYPELPEGTFRLSDARSNEHVAGKCLKNIDKELDRRNSESRSKLEEVCGDAVKEEDFHEREKGRKESTDDTDKMTSVSIFNSNEKANDLNEGGCGGGDATLSLSESELVPKDATSGAEDKRSDCASSTKKHPIGLVDGSKTQKSRPKIKKYESASTLYKSNLEKFIGYLMNDDALRSVNNIATLDKTLVESQTTIGGRRFVKTSGGHNYIVNFQEANEDKSTGRPRTTSTPPMTSTKTECNEESQRCEIVDCRQNADSVKLSTDLQQRDLNIPSLDKSYCSSKDRFSPSGTGSDASIGSSVSNMSSKSNEPKTVKKADEEFDSATSDCGDSHLNGDSLEEFFLSLRENDKLEETTENGGARRSRIFREMKSEPSVEKSFQAAPKNPLWTNADIETMWLSFVRLFFPNLENHTGRALEPIIRSHNPGHYPQYSNQSMSAMPELFAKPCHYEPQVTSKTLSNASSNCIVQYDSQLKPGTSFSRMSQTNSNKRMFFNPSVASPCWWLK